MLILALVGMTFLSACGGSSGGGSTSSTSSGDGAVVASSLSSYMMPAEISAVPAITSTESASLVTALRSLARAYTDEDTDYSKAHTRKFVEEHSLEQFAILEEVLKALNQTKYYDQIGQPAYKAMVAMVDGGDEGKEQKSLEAWVVEADIIDGNENVVDLADAVEGVDYDVRVRAWIEEEDQLIKAQFVITDEPTQYDDGSYANYGAWTLNVKFDDEGAEYFAASCEVGESGESILKLHEIFGPEGPGSVEEGGLEVEVKAMMYRSETTGYGKVFYPDWEAMWNPESEEELTEIPSKTTKYAYNDDFLALQEGSGDPVVYDPAVYKDRSNLVEMTHHYGVFEADTGKDLMKTKQFGFPIKYTDETTSHTKRGYYGAWQGRHQLWMEFGEGGSASGLEGTTVTKEDHHSDSDADAQTYTIGKTFAGTLVKRTYVDASLDDIKNIPVEIWVNQDYQLTFNDTTEKWYHCPAVNWETHPPSCDETPVDFDAEIGFASLAVGENDNRKNVNIGGWDETNQEDKQFVYLPANSVEGGNEAGLYEAMQHPTKSWKMVAKNPLVPINTDNVMQLWVWIGGSLYVEYKGAETGWVEKELVDFDQRSWMPEFGDNDKPYILPEGRELYINMQGASYIVRKDLEGNVTTKLELQTAINPSNADDLIPEGTVLAEPWCDNNSTYEFITDPTNTKYLMLVYKEIGDNDKDQEGNSDKSVGDLVTTGMWGLEATIAGETDPVSFNWEYSANEGWGSVTYLMDGDDYVLLDDPVRFDAITVGEKTLALQYDGWMMGLPDLYHELSKNDWVMTTDISEKIINLPAGTAVTETATETDYVLKPIEISQFLLPAADDTDESLFPDITLADDVELDDVPAFVEHGMGAMPEGTTVKYSEGILVEAE
jgi:hypothetical protein